MSSYTESTNELALGFEIQLSLLEQTHLTDIVNDYQNTWVPPPIYTYEAQIVPQMSVGNTEFTLVYTWIYNGLGNSDPNKGVLDAFIATTFMESLPTDDTSHPDFCYHLRVFDVTNKVVLYETTHLYNQVPEEIILPLENLSQETATLELHAQKGTYGSRVKVIGGTLRYSKQLF